MDGFGWDGAGWVLGVVISGESGTTFSGLAANAEPPLHASWLFSVGSDITCFGVIGRTFSVCRQYPLFVLVVKVL